MDHHQALVLGRRATETAAGRGGRTPDEVRDELVRRFHAELAPHFEVEERLLLPALAEAGEAALVERTLDEHRRLRVLAAECADAIEPSQAPLAGFGELLTAHVRFEERTLFPAAEVRLASSILEEIAAASEELVANRPAAACSASSDEMGDVLEGPT